MKIMGMGSFVIHSLVLTARFSNVYNQACNTSTCDDRHMLMYVDMTHEIWAGGVKVLFYSV
jgi:hypothetical protein